MIFQLIAIGFEIEPGPGKKYTLYRHVFSRWVASIHRCFLIQINWILTLCVTPAMFKVTRCMHKSGDPGISTMG
ncbi:MAG: hypothetical protein HN931_09925 [Desulfobacterales bacterium]|nr:hypothetical protein [Desulfobacterales bacterium]